MFSKFFITNKGNVSNFLYEKNRTREFRNSESASRQFLRVSKKNIWVGRFLAQSVGLPQTKIILRMAWSPSKTFLKFRTKWGILGLFELLIILFDSAEQSQKLKIKYLKKKRIKI